VDRLAIDLSKPAIFGILSCIFLSLNGHAKANISTKKAPQIARSRVSIPHEHEKGTGSAFPPPCQGPKEPHDQKGSIICKNPRIPGIFLRISSSNMLEKTHRLTQKRDFDKLANKGRSVFGPFATMRVRSVTENKPKIAFITSTKVMKLAVDRNRIKRRLRAILRELLPTVPPAVHLLFVVKPEALKADYPTLKAEIERLLTKIPEALTKPAKPSPGALRKKAKYAARDARPPSV
jgi:ribonuclease P protein component